MSEHRHDWQYVQHDVVCLIPGCDERLVTDELAEHIMYLEGELHHLAGMDLEAVKDVVEAAENSRIVFLQAYKLLKASADIAAKHRNPELFEDAIEAIGNLEIIYKKLDEALARLEEK